MAQLNYEQMIDRALLSVVKAALRHIAKEGTEGEHHFYLSFLTGYPGVQLPDHIKQAYPDEITIVLQHEFWNLEVAENHFTVDVKFDTEVPNTVVVPFQAITHVSDPDENFELEFNPKVGNVQAFDALSKGASKASESADGTLEPVFEGEGKGTVVSLDSFRKK
ncbi:MAG: hypothetical protein H6925_02370 [Holosporaceae bacterium]|nr:MAG: hypothetical protein H6925_02370 [Holosporaceae bacterium]